MEKLKIAIYQKVMCLIRLLVPHHDSTKAHRTVVLFCFGRLVLNEVCTF